MDFLDQSKALDGDETSCVDYGARFDSHLSKRKLYVYANGSDWFDQNIVTIDFSFLSYSAKERGEKADRLVIAQKVRLNNKDFVFTINPALESPEAKRITESVMKFELRGSKILKIARLDFSRSFKVFDLPSPQDVLDPNFVYKEPKYMWTFDDYREQVICKERPIPQRGS